MGAAPRRAAGSLTALILCTGCSLLVSGSGEDPDAGGNDPADAAVGCPAPEPTACAPDDCVCTPETGCQVVQMRFSIGALDRDFSTIGEWEEARAGDLVGRRVLAVSDVSGPFTPGEVVAGSGCSGQFVPPGALQTQATEMSLDSFTGVCQSGDTLQGAISNSTVTFQRLLGIGTIERGEAHADARFAEQVNIGGSTSSAANFMWLVAAEGSEHRGVAGAGVIIDPPNMPTNNSHAVMIRDDFVRVEGLEITDWFRGTSTSRGIFVDGARDVLIQHMLIHDDGDGENGSGIDGVFGGNSDGMGPASRFTVANSVIYRVSQSAIRASNMSSVRLVNVTAYECGLATHTSEIGCIDSDNQPVTEAVNVVSLVGPNSVGNVEAFDGAFIANSSHNLSSDTSAPGTDEIHGVDPESLFANPGQADLRLGDPDSAAGANLCDTDPELSVTIEGQARPMNGPWPRGAY